jgi:chromosome segregation ATPase
MNTNEQLVESINAIAHELVGYPSTNEQIRAAMLVQELNARNQQFQELRQEHEETLRRMQFYKEEWNELRIDRQELVEEIVGLKQLLAAVANHAAACADTAGCGEVVK